MWRAITSESLTEADGVWFGSVEIAGRQISCTVNPNGAAMTRERAVELTLPLYRLMTQQEPELRLAGVHEIALAAGEGAPESEARRYRDEIEIAAAALRLSAITLLLNEGGQLEYRDDGGSFYGGARVLIRFNALGAFEESELS